jgi:transcriptional regulator with GAF, ATPase, and Fis domain
MKVKKMSRNLDVGPVFVELADTLVTDFDVVEFLHTLARRCVELLEVNAAGLILADQRGKLRVAASSSEAVRLLELFELQNDEGPCLDCYRTGNAIINTDAASAASRWPRFTAESQAAGFHSVHALPLRLRLDVIGALNLFRSAPGLLGTEEIELGQALADIATIGLLQARAIREREILAEQLQAALNSRIVIEQAKGVLAAAGNLAMDEAFELMRGHARRSGRRLHEVARGVIEGATNIAWDGDRPILPLPPAY